MAKLHVTCGKSVQFRQVCNNCVRGHFDVRARNLTWDTAPTRCNSLVLRPGPFLQHVLIRYFNETISSILLCKIMFPVMPRHTVLIFGTYKNKMK